MSILLRKKLEASYEDYFNHLYKVHGGIPENHMAAIIMRMNFTQNKILDRQPHEWKTPTERDWSYVIRREYIYDCNIMPMCHGITVGLLGMMARQVMVKRWVMWPFFPLFVGTYIYTSRQAFRFNNKKYFDMANLGE